MRNLKICWSGSTTGNTVTSYKIAYSPITSSTLSYITGIPTGTTCYTISGLTDYISYSGYVESECTNCYSSNRQYWKNINACFYNLIESPEYLMCLLPNYYRFYTDSMIVNGKQYITGNSINHDITHLNWISAHNNVISGCTNGSGPTGFTYTDQIDFMNQLFTTLGLKNYKAQISIYPDIYPFYHYNEINGFYIIKPENDTFEFTITSADGFIEETTIIHNIRESIKYSDNMSNNIISYVSTEPIFICDGKCHNYYLNDNLVVIEGDKKLTIPIVSITGDNSPVSFNGNAEFYITGTTGTIVNYSFHYWDLYNPINNGNGFIKSGTITLTSGINTITYTNTTSSIVLIIDNIINPTNGCQYDEYNTFDYVDISQ